jgi:hypothetical protein
MKNFIDRLLSDEAKASAGAFEASGYRNAVLSFLRERFPEWAGRIEAMSVHTGLKVIRALIQKKARLRGASAR